MTLSHHNIDILMVVHTRGHYLEHTLPRLLDQCDEQMGVWVWQNGLDPNVTKIVDECRSHPRLHRLHRSPANVGLVEPTNWMWTQSYAEYVSKIDDDCMLPSGWARALEQAHKNVPAAGALAACRLHADDLLPELPAAKVAGFERGQEIMRNVWVQGSGYLLRRDATDVVGPLRAAEQFPTYCRRLARAGLVNGWVLPFLFEDHLDDPRSPSTALRDVAEFEQYRPLSAQLEGITTLDDWEHWIRANAYVIQMADPDVRRYSRPRRLLRRTLRRLGADISPVPLLPEASWPPPEPASESAP